MDLLLDIKRSIVVLLRINDIKNLSQTDKSFYYLCSERNLWLEKFKEKNLEIINNEINTVGQYINEYRKVSYSFYTASHVVDMVINTNYRLYRSACFFDVVFSINDIKNILDKEHLIFTKIKEYNIKECITITIEIKEKGSINYNYRDEFNTIHHFLRQNDGDKKFIISLIGKILYYYPLITIHDVDGVPIIISKNSIIDDDTLIHYHLQLNSRIKYWDECYSKYENLYF